MKRLLVCLGLHALLALLVPVAWLVPNLALLGLISATIRQPQHGPLYGLLAAASLLPWLLSSSAAVACLILYGLIGSALAALARRFDLHDARLRYVVMTAAAGVVTFGLLSVKAAGSWTLLAWGVAQVAITVLAAAGWHGLWEG